MAKDLEIIARNKALQYIADRMTELVNWQIELNMKELEKIKGESAQTQSS